MGWLKRLVRILDGLGDKPPKGWQVFPSPGFATKEQAVDWLLDKGAVEIHLWRGPDGLTRGFGVVR